MKSTQFWYCMELAERYGTIQRARGCYLYTRKGKRLVDMYQELGRAILGWGNSKAMTEFKNTMNRGLTGSFLTDYNYRLEKAVKALLPEYDHVRWYSSLPAAQQALSVYFGKDMTINIGEHPILDTTADQYPEEMLDYDLDEWLESNGVSRWRPWLDEAWFNSEQNIPEPVLEIHEKVQDAVVVVPPLALARTYYLITFNDTGNRTIPPSDVLLPPVLAATARAIYDLIAELPCRSEKDWNQFDSIVLKYWKRKGPYLLPKVPQEKYKEFFLHCLDCGILISPNYRTPTIVPYGANAGDFKKLAKNPFKF